MKGNGRSVNLVGRAGDEKEQGEEEGGSCVWDVLYESKINLKKRKKWKKVFEVQKGKGARDEMRNREKSSKMNYILKHHKESCYFASQ